MIGFLIIITIIQYKKYIKIKYSQTGVWGDSIITVQPPN